MRRFRFAAVAIVLLILSALLMHERDTARAGAKKEEVHLPRYPTPEEHQRRTTRRTLLERAAAASADSAEAAAPSEDRPADPMHAVLPYVAGEALVIVEASAIRHSELGERFLECLDRGATAELETIEAETGIDFLEKLDRIGAVEDMLVMTGSFEGFGLPDRAREAYGDHGTIFAPEGHGGYAALWRDEMLIVAGSADELKAKIDQLEGRRPIEDTSALDRIAYGEVYGSLPVDRIAELIPDEHAELRERFLETAEDIELHASVGDDVGLVAHVRGDERASGIGDLAKSIGGAMALARTFARSQDEEDLAEILELARVVPHGSSFEVELALPSELLIEHLIGECAPRRADGGAP